MALRKSPRGQALLISGIVVVIYAVGITALDLVGMMSNIYWQAGLGLFLFIVSFFIIHQVFLRYVEKRLNPVFKTIQKVAMSQKKIRERIDSSDFSDTLDQEVKTWATSQTAEIRQLREMEKYRKDFLGNVSHELKTPIFNIQGYILTLLEGGIDDPKVNKLYLKRAEKSINRMISIVDDLVSISRLESGEFKLKLEVFNIVKLVEEVFEHHEMLARQFRVKLEFDSGYSRPIRVSADRRRMTEVLNNLIVNSIKYGRTNGKTRVGFIDTGERILVDISDNGIGIDETDLPRIFERFYRVDKSRSRDSGGTGLGLAIVKHIIQAHNQTINVRSALGKGTSFVFSLNKSD
jgi:two-component system phosphate regulon sensor histidine kinase PhoR